MPEPRLATTVVLLRPAPTGLSVFLVQRHHKSGFFPSAWVFPGGRVDPEDRLAEHPGVRGGERALSHLGLEREQGIAVLVAGVRETFEESGIWLGSGSLPEATRRPLARSELSLAALLEEHGATVDLDRLAPWSWWITPEAEPRRYDTRFVVALAGDEGRHDDHETVDSGWFTPANVLDQAEAGEVHLAPPTWWTLRELSALARPEAAVQAAWTRPQRPIQPMLHVGDGSVELWLPGHPEHPDPALEGLPWRITLRGGRWHADLERP